MKLKTYKLKDTFLAFTDISGFKSLMKEGRGPEALDIFFNGAYGLLKIAKRHYLDGIFMSDCGILFARNDLYPNLPNTKFLEELLHIIKDLNLHMLEKGYMLTTSIAYGKFEYIDRIVLENMDKVYIHGNAYLDAYRDNSDGGVLKIEPGYCRILKEGLPQDIQDRFNESVSNGMSDVDSFKMVRPRNGDDKHYYYYWMREDPYQIKEFEKKYSDSYELKYAGMKEALKSNG